MPISIQNEVTERISAFSGIKSSLPFGVLQPMDAEDILNFVSRRGKLRKIWGGTLYYTSGLFQSEIKWIEYFQYRWMAQHGDTIIREFTEGQANFVSIGDMLLGAQNRVHSEKWENRIFLSNSVENKFVEAVPALSPLVSFLNLGLTPPGNGAKPDVLLVPDPIPTTSKVAHLGSTLADADYAYVVTWWDNEREVESLPNAAQVGEDGLWKSFAFVFSLFNKATYSSMTDNAVRVDITPLKSAGYDPRVTHFIVYRGTQADTATFKRVADPIAIANDYYDDSTIEADLGQVLDESLSPPPSGKFYQGLGTAADASACGPGFVKFFRDQLWLFGVNFPGTENGYKTNSSGTGLQKINYFPQSGIVYASQVNNFDYWQFDYGIGRATGQKDTGIAKFRNVLMFFKEGSAYYLSGSSPDNYEIQEMDANRGIIASGSLKETTIGPIGLSIDGFTLFDGVGPGKPISDEIFDKIQQINLDYHDKITASFDPLEEKYECHVPIDEFSWNTRVFTFDCKTKCWEVTDRAGGAAAYGLGTNKNAVSLLGDPRNGRLYKTDNYAKVTMNGRTMFGSWRSKAFDFQHPGELKNVQFIEIVASCVKDFRLSIDLIPDFGQGDSVSIEDHPPDLRTGEWAADSNDDANLQWDAGQWEKGVRKKKFTILVQCIGKNFNLVVRNSDSDADKASFDIEEIILHASLIDGDDD